MIDHNEGKNARDRMLKKRKRFSNIKFVENIEEEFIKVGCMY
jgi:hypothetical protein